MAENKNSIQSVVSSLLNGAAGAFADETVIGDPVTIGDTTIIPLSDVSIGCAAGSNNGDRKDSGMGGFAAKVSPSAVLVIKEGSVRVINIKNQDAVSKLVDFMPDLVDRFTGMQLTGKNSDGISKDEAIEIAFPERKE